jgi:hypothetical protein
VIWSKTYFFMKTENRLKERAGGIYRRCPHRDHQCCERRPVFRAPYDAR